MAAPPMTTAMAVFYHARIGRNELDRLFRVASDGAAPGRTTLTCVPAQTTVQADTLDDLIVARAGLPAVSERTPWTYLHYEMDEQPDRHVELEFREGEVTVIVEAVNSIWAHGQFARLEAIIRNSRGGKTEVSWRKLRRFFSWYLLMGVIGTTALYSAPNLLGLDSSCSEGTGGAVLASWTVIVAMICSMLWRYRSVRPQFNAVGEVRHGSFWTRLTIPEQIGLSANVIAGLALFVALLALIWGK
ncbi:hypothetical protein ACFCW6_13710 [Streptomyces sp. NPDC056333]|uniref:hypothetical protein n=1 Tax=Streptomyces sp. NPDC056333 TaxID=3345786 RepID=UPI0035DB7A97